MISETADDASRPEDFTSRRCAILFVADRTAAVLAQNGVYGGVAVHLRVRE
jgi:hypothetical protein